MGKKNSIGMMMKGAPKFKKIKTEKIEGFKIPAAMTMEKETRKAVEKALKRLRKNGFVVIDNNAGIKTELCMIVPGLVLGQADAESFYFAFLPKSIEKPITMKEDKKSKVQKAAEKGAAKVLHPQRTFPATGC